MALIAEIKKASPSKGLGSAPISTRLLSPAPINQGGGMSPRCLPTGPSFQGSFSDLSEATASNAFAFVFVRISCSIPIKYMKHGRMAADCILIIVMACAHRRGGLRLDPRGA